MLEVEVFAEEVGAEGSEPVGEVVVVGFPFGGGVITGLQGRMAVFCGGEGGGVEGG